MGFNMWMYNIWDGHSFGLLQAIHAVEQGKYDLMLLAKTKILNAVYCQNRLVYDVVYY